MQQSNPEVHLVQLFGPFSHSRHSAMHRVSESNFEINGFVRESCEKLRLKETIKTMQKKEVSLIEKVVERAGMRLNMKEDFLINSV